MSKIFSNPNLNFFSEWQQHFGWNYIIFNNYSDINCCAVYIFIANKMGRIWWESDRSVCDYNKVRKKFNTKFCWNNHTWEMHFWALKTIF